MKQPRRLNLPIILLAILCVAGTFLSACENPTLPLPAIDPGIIGLSSSTPQPTATPLASATPAATPTPAPTQAPHLQVKAEQLKDVKIQIWHPWTGQAELTLQRLIKNFNQDNIWGIQVEATSMGGAGALFDQVSSRINLKQGKPPQLVVASSEQLLTWQANGDWVVDLNDYIHHNEWGLTSQEVVDFTLSFWEQDQVGGKRLGLPATRNAPLLFYNQTWGRELGFSAPPQTPDELKLQACAAAKVNAASGEKEKKGTGGLLLSTDPTVILSWMTAFGANPSNAGEESYRFNTPEALAGMQYQRDLFDKSCAWTSRLASPYDYFVNRQALFYSGWLHDISAQSAAFAHQGHTDEWTVIPFPGKDGQPVILVTATSYAMLRSEPAEQLAAWLFLRWLALPQNQSLMVNSTYSFPYSASANKEVSEQISQPAQWKRALNYIPLARPAPRQAVWRTIRRALEDAAWQTFQSVTPPTQIGDLLRQLDEISQELIRRSSATP